MLWAMDTNATLNADLDILGKLAEHGLTGVIIAVIAACVIIIALFAVSIIIFHWLEVRRYERKEIKRDTQLAAIRIEENDSRAKLAETQTRLSDNIGSLTKLVETTSERLYENIKDVKVKVENLSDNVDELKTTVDKHEKDIIRHDGLLQEYSSDYQPQIVVKKRANKNKR